jgi:tRNA modification GTPase
MAKTLERANEADLFLLVFDVTGLPPPGLPLGVTDKVTSQNSIIIFNKSDLGNTGPTLSLSSDIPVRHVSALTGEGIEALIAEIILRADSFQQQVGTETIAINARHADALGQARLCLFDAQAKLAANEPIELLAGCSRPMGQSRARSTTSACSMPCSRPFASANRTRATPTELNVPCPLDSPDVSKRNSP